MTEEQIERNAEEYGADLCAICRECECEKPCHHKKDAMYGYKDGLRYGYHECQKEHEWHKVSEVGLPKKSGRYFVYAGGGENGVYPLDFETEYNDFGYWCLQVGENLGVSDTIFETITERKEDKVIAWKEIVLPKEIE